jgi:hypothetical protein
MNAMRLSFARDMKWILTGFVSRFRFAIEVAEVVGIGYRREKASG